VVAVLHTLGSVSLKLRRFESVLEWFTRRREGAKKEDIAALQSSCFFASSREKFRKRDVAYAPFDRTDMI
jgi:hypothetical protein